MEKLKYIFRGTEDNYTFHSYGSIHLIILAFFIFGIWFIYKNKDKDAFCEMILKAISKVLLLDQIILYIWQFKSGFFNIEQSLPLYHCRIATWLVILGVLANKKTFKITGMYFGAMGSLMGLLVADLYKFSFPHYTNFQFFLVHILLGWSAALILFSQKEKISEIELKKSLLITNILNVIILTVDFILRKKYMEVNYGYLLTTPEMIKIKLGTKLNIIVMMSIFNIAIILMYKIFNTIIKKIVLNKSEGSKNSLH